MAAMGRKSTDTYSRKDGRPTILGGPPTSATTGGGKPAGAGDGPAWKPAKPSGGTTSGKAGAYGQTVSAAAKARKAASPSKGKSASARTMGATKRKRPRG